MPILAAMLRVEAIVKRRLWMYLLASPLLVIVPALVGSRTLVVWTGSVVLGVGLGLTLLLVAAMILLIREFVRDAWSEQ